jgi:hypothetical protein
MKIKFHFTVAYFVTFLATVVISIILDGKQPTNEVKSGILFGTLFIMIVGVIISLVIEAILNFLNKRVQAIARFIIMLVALDLIFFWISRFELISSLLDFKGQRFQTALPVLVVH